MATNSNFHVLIIGGGNCGLAIATGLKKAGIKYTVFERDSEDDFVNRPRDWGMLLHWGTEYLAKVLPPHLQNRIKEPRVDPANEMVEPIPYFDARSGEIMKRVPTDVINRVSRRKLRRFLTEGEDLRIKFGKRLQKMSVKNGTVTITFEDGTVASGSVAVGADGSHSKVREFLVGPEAAELEDTGHTMINFPYRGYTPEQARLLRSFHPIVQLCNHQDLGSALLAALDISDPQSPQDWKFQVYTSWWGPPFVQDLQDPQERMRFFKKRMEQFCEPFRTASLAVSDDEVIPIYPGKQWSPTTRWDNHGGRVTLAGDAAHSMLPHRGQGLNNALKDASDIVDAIQAAVSGSQSLSAAVSAYEDEMRPRGAKEVALSLEQALASRNGTFENSPVWKIGHSREEEQTSK